MRFTKFISTIHITKTAGCQTYRHTCQHWQYLEHWVVITGTMAQCGRNNRQKQTNKQKYFVAENKNMVLKQANQIAQGIAKRGKPFTDGKYIKEAFE